MNTILSALIGVAPVAMSTLPIAAILAVLLLLAGVCTLVACGVVARAGNR